MSRPDRLTKATITSDGFKIRARDNHETLVTHLACGGAHSVDWLWARLTVWSIVGVRAPLGPHSMGHICTPHFVLVLWPAVACPLKPQEWARLLLIVMFYYLQKEKCLKYQHNFSWDKSIKTFLWSVTACSFCFAAPFASFCPYYYYFFTLAAS